MLRSLSAAPLILLATTALAHEDDPKLLDRQEAVRGPGWTLGSTRAATVGGAGSIPASSMMFPAQGVELLAWMTLDDLGLNSSSGNDCWGYTSPSGRKYALMGTANGTSFVEITNPTQPVLVAAISGPSSLWRDIKTYQDHAYVVSEGGGGVQVFDMSQIDSGNVIQRPSVTSGPGTSATHNVAIDTTSGFLYRTGGGDEGLRIYSLANPSFPQYVAEWPDRYVHDAQAITFTSGPYAGRQIVFACSGFNGGFGDTAVDVLDVTNKQNIIEMSRESWPSAAYSHQAWLGENAQYLYVNDELDENGSINTRTVVLDVSNLNNATYVGSFSCPTPAVGQQPDVAPGDRLLRHLSGERLGRVQRPVERLPLLRRRDRDRLRPREGALRLVRGRSGHRPRRARSSDSGRLGWRFVPGPDHRSRSWRSRSRQCAPGLRLRNRPPDLGPGRSRRHSSGTLPTSALKGPTVPGSAPKRSCSVPST
ncbi:MAG: choice-of-anchor B family protein [Planctomycetota bacterium]|jgi:choice-of-anchor B domain-containing protein